MNTQHFLDAVPEWNSTAAETTCAICGDRSAAFWHGETTVAVCGRCATEVLPALIADATVPARSRHGYAAATSVIERVATRFWRAAAAQFNR